MFVLVVVCGLDLYVFNFSKCRRYCVLEIKKL